jgi:hypothetical protein
MSRVTKVLGIRSEFPWNGSRATFFRRIRSKTPPPNSADSERPPIPTFHHPHIGESCVVVRQWSDKCPADFKWICASFRRSFDIRSTSVPHRSTSFHICSTSVPHALALKSLPTRARIRWPNSPAQKKLWPRPNGPNFHKFRKFGYAPGAMVRLIYWTDSATLLGGGVRRIGITIDVNVIETHLFLEEFGGFVDRGRYAPERKDN